MPKLTKAQVKAMTPGQTLQIGCEDVGEWQSAGVTARTARREMGLAPEMMQIKESSKDLQLTIIYRSEPVTESK